MSRIGKLPIPVPEKVEITIDDTMIKVKGPKGELEQTIPDFVTITQENSQILVNRVNDSRKARERHGLARTLIANMVHGVSKGFEQRLQIQGVGYRAQVQGRNLILNVGYSHPVEITPPEGLQIAVEKNTEIIISGINKELVGNLTAKIRAIRPPEPYKGKGIRYLGEQVRQKAGKAGKK
ncbi:MAG: 50S ribosomal protein L6 [Halothece sp.]